MNFNNFILSGFDFDDDEYELKLRFVLLNCLLSAVALMLLFMSIIRYSQGDPAQSFVDATAAFLSIIALILARRSKDKLKFLLIVLLFLFFILISFTFVHEGFVAVGWYLVLLLAVFFLKGKKKGLFFSILSFISILALAQTGYVNYSIYSFIYILVPLSISVVFLYLYEQRNELIKHLLLQKQDALQKEILKKSNELSQIMQTSLIEIYILDFDTDTYLYANEGATKELGYTLTQLQQFTIYDISPTLSKESVERFKENSSKKHNAMNLYQHIRKDGSNYGVQSFIHKITYENKDAYVMYDIKITDELKAQAEILRQKEMLSYQANYDLLTKLPNRTLFDDRLNQAIVKAKRSKKHFALLFIDLDHFKEVNDTYGHKAGDVVLIEIAKRLQASVRESDTVARFAGDEFLIILENFDSHETLKLIAKNIVKSLAVPIEYNNTTYYVTCSIGIALYPQDAQDAETLLRFSDKAMYSAKDAGKNNFTFY